MAATNDARHVMTQIIRGLRGGRRPRNLAEKLLVEGEQSYLERTLCGHLYEAGTAFRCLWDIKSAQTRLAAAIALNPPAQSKLDLVVRDFVNPPADGLQKRFLYGIRNHWAFHYQDLDYQTALRRAKGKSRVLIADTRGRSRYVIVDDFVKHAVRKLSGKTAKQYDADLRRAVELAGALGVVVDAMILGLLNERGSHSFTRRDFVLTMDRGLTRGRRDAIARRLIANP